MDNESLIVAGRLAASLIFAVSAALLGAHAAVSRTPLGDKVHVKWGTLELAGPMLYAIAVLFAILSWLIFPALGEISTARLTPRHTAAVASDSVSVASRPSSRPFP